MQHLYIHIPFCHRRCSYCDFNTYANMDDRIEAYVQALCSELAMLAEHGELAPSVTALKPTIFFGGGTPTMLTLNQFERVLSSANALVPLNGAEVTTEANPGTVIDRDYLRGLRSLGINRLSMGVQTLHDPTLRVLGRIHTAAEARQSLADARWAGFDNISLDFMFGLPGQTQQQWETALDEIIQWDVDHFSLYSLILETTTPLYAQVTAGHVSVPSDDATAAMYEAAIARLADARYSQYEISNWARGGERTSDTFPFPYYACHHNLAYWLNSNYLAAGAGAHGHIYPQRYHDILAIDAYIASVQRSERPVAEVIALSHADLCTETMFMGLRLNHGVGRAHFAARCGVKLSKVYGHTIAELETLGLLISDDAGVRLTPRGQMLGNQVFERFV